MDDAVNFALVLARVWVGAVMFVHGWRHVKALQSGPGMANWRLMASLSAPASCGSVRVAQSIEPASVLSVGRATGGAGRARTPTDPDGA